MVLLSGQAYRGPHLWGGEPHIAVLVFEGSLGPSPGTSRLRARPRHFWAWVLGRLSRTRLGCALAPLRLHRI